MGKVLLFLAVGAVVWWFWRKARARPEAAPSIPKPAELMVVCAHCGVNQPRSECIESGGRLYCSDVHRQAAEQAGGCGRD